MPTRLCADSSCPEPAVYRGRCAEHAQANERTVCRAGYHLYRTKRWEITRRSFLFAHPLCDIDGCDELATDVHHRIDIAHDGNPWAFENLQALCAPCHSRITRARLTRTEQPA